jgi:pimeloyl-ACP methyl ester carboxylesterase
LVEPIFAATSAERLLNLYGPTEDTVYSTCSNVRRGERITIGRPMTNRRAYILDRHRRPVPVGVTGELYVAGEGLARGYFGRPDLTAERFVSGSEAGEERMYRTGDLCRWLPDGRIFYLGRADHQVKVRGFRIEPGEIEAALGRHPGVRECVVVAREDGRGEKQLVAYIATDQGGGPAPGELRDLAGRFVPKYMVPTVFVRLPQLPRTLNGKIDRKSLPAPAPTDYGHSREYVGPRTVVEHRLAAIWEDVLATKRVGIRDSFFEIGGQSLLALRLFTKISSTFGKDLPLSTLFECPTIEQLARRIEERSAVTYSRLTPIQPNGSKPPLFCVHGGRGGTLFLHTVATLVDQDRPFFGIEPEGLDGREMRHKTIESVAASYVAEIRKVQPRGPYYLGGYCFGGIVAFEMAQQLLRSGEQIAALVLLTAPLRFGGRRRQEAESPKQPEQTPVGPIGWIREGIGWRSRLWRVRWKKLRLRLFFSLGRRIPQSERGDYVARNLYEAEKRYRPEPYPGTLVLIRSSRMRQLGPDFGWDGLARRVEHRVVGESEFEDRRELFQDPLAEITARELREYFESSAQNGNGGSSQDAAD